MNQPLIQPRTLPGFRDFLPTTMMAREKCMAIARTVFRQFGFVPIDTPTLEYTEILLGKGGDETDKQLFRFEQGKRDVAMRFDLTIPFARYAAQHMGELGTPFKRYHIAPVWRGERPQRGRFREFIQCDFDTIGTESNAADIETLLVINDLLTALGFSRFSIRVNHRQLLNGLLEGLNLQNASVEILRALDKLPKIGREKVIEEMVQTAGTTAEQAASVLDFAALSGTSSEILSQAEAHLSESDAGKEGIQKLKELFDCVATVGLPEGRVSLDLSIARGLDYYTGTIFETFLDDLPEIGSVCSGGRYDNLAGLYTKQKLPGVGASLGLDRLLAAMEELNLIEEAGSSVSVLITQLSTQYLGDYFRVSRLLHDAKIGCAVFPESKGLGKQLKFATRNKIRFALIAGEEEFAKKEWQVKDLQNSEQATVSEDNLIPHLKNLMQ